MLSGLDAPIADEEEAIAELERVLARAIAGQSMADVPVQAVAGKPFQIDLPLAPLAAGQYLLQLDAKTPSGAAQQMVAFAINR
jgi:hypothetical protein